MQSRRSYPYVGANLHNVVLATRSIRLQYAKFRNPHQIPSDTPPKLNKQERTLRQNDNGQLNKQERTVSPAGTALGSAYHDNAGVFHTVTSATPFCYAIHAAFTLPTAAFMRNYVQGRWVQVLHNGETLRPPISFGGDDIATRSCSDSCSVPTGPCRVILMHRKYVQGRWAQVLHNGVPQGTLLPVLEVTSLAIGGLRLIQHTAGGKLNHATCCHRGAI